jgi:hypothetical protein
VDRPISEVGLVNLLELVGSEITTSVKGATGNGGNINITTGLTVLDHFQHHRPGGRGQWRQHHERCRSVRRLHRQHRLGLLAEGHLRGGRDQRHYPAERRARRVVERIAQTRRFDPE